MKATRNNQHQNPKIRKFVYLVYTIAEAETGCVSLRER